MVKKLGYIKAVNTIRPNPILIMTVEVESKDDKYDYYDIDFLKPHYKVIKIENLEGIEQDSYTDYFMEFEKGKYVELYKIYKKGDIHKFSPDIDSYMPYDICRDKDILKSDIIRHLITKHNLSGNFQHNDDLKNVTYHVKHSYIDDEDDECDEYDEFMVINGMIEGERKKRMHGHNIVTNYVNGVSTQVLFDGKNLDEEDEDESDGE
jgi:hypothetical protein